MFELNKYNLNDAIFIDIETTRSVKELDIDSPLFDAWKYDRVKDGQLSDTELVDAYNERAALFPEFGKITVISVGRITKDNKSLVLKSYYNEDEKLLLEEFVKDIEQIAKAKPKAYFAGHAIIDFDMPYISKRLLINGMPLPLVMDYSGLKPWQVNILDTKPLWRMTGAFPSSLLTISTVLGLPSPKDDISGKEAAQLPYSGEEGAYERIARYCEKDVLTVAQIVRKLRGEELLEKNSLTPEAEEKLDIVQYLFDGGEYTEEIKALLVDFLTPLNKKEREEVYVILNSICSTARGKETNIKKSDVTALKKEMK